MLILIKATQKDYINVTYNLTTMRDYYQVILSYYVDGKRKQKWKSLKMKVAPRY